MDSETKMNNVIMYVFYYIVCIFTGGMFGGFLEDLPFSTSNLFYGLLEIITDLFNDLPGLTIALLFIAFIMSILAFSAAHLCMYVLNNFIILKIKYDVLLFVIGYIVFAVSALAFIFATIGMITVD